MSSHVDLFRVRLIGIGWVLFCCAVVRGQSNDQGFVDLLQQTRSEQADATSPKNPTAWTLSREGLVGESVPEISAEQRWVFHTAPAPIGNFELRLQFRVLRGDCDLTYRYSKQGGRQKGYRVTLSNDSAICGNLVDMASLTPAPEADQKRQARHKTEILAIPGEQVILMLDGERSVRRSANPNESPATVDEPGKWHALSVVAVANHVTHTIDGDVVVDVVDQRFHDRSLSGAISLGLGSGSRIEVRAVEFRPIPGIFPPWEGDDADALFAESATAGSEIAVPPGFSVELLYSVPRDQEGSWVAMTIDAKGHFIVAAHDGGLYRIVLSTPSLTVEPLNTSIRGAQGLETVGERLYVVVNGRDGDGPGLYCLLDSDQDNEYEDVRKLKSFEGSGDHGPHGVVASRDGKSLFVIAGNDTKLPADLARSRVPQFWQEDQLLPRMNDPTGFATWNAAPNGWICRTDLDGKQWELVAVGLRNAYDLAIDPSGELFTCDADMEFDTGLPWYRPARVNHVPSGAEFGYRHGSGKWPEYFADSVPAAVDIGLASPTGLVFGDRARFPKKYRTSLFVLDWAFGTIYAVQLRPAGGGFAGTFEKFATAKPLPVTDAAIGPDGALYFVTGGRGTQSGLYRIRYVGSDDTEANGPTRETLDRPSLLLRRRLESYHETSNNVHEALTHIWPHLANPDRSLRYAARVALEHQPWQSWRTKALSESDPLISIQAMIALSRAVKPHDTTEVGLRDLREDVLRHLSRLRLTQFAEPTLLEALRAMDLAMIRGGIPEGDLRAAVIGQLNQVYPHSSDLVNRELCKLLVALQDDGLPTKTLPLLMKSTTQQQQISLAFSLREASGGWSDENRKKYFDWFDLAIAEYAGAPTFRDYLTTARKEALAHVPKQNQAAYQPVRPTTGGDARSIPVARKHVYNWQMSDLRPKLAELSTGRSFPAGQGAFVAARCAECHRVRNQGGNSGPDLTSIGARFSGREVLESIIEPSRVIADLYKQSTIVTADGKLLTGRILEETGDALRMQIGAGSEVKIVEVPRVDIDERLEANLSTMPSNLLSVLTQEEVLDLLAYLLSGGDASNQAFAEADRRPAAQDVEPIE